ncbi:MAG: hypothetical protein ALECFALPRED_008966 [Alectoria fallacina]|uniref:Uncharacterized protein n=1 Tax=Alectoria fallacina TaxID=1903189 RepID=A0A8H3J594_9LECA|nr:MAG: hypothetical protein ALECFALPRED_008966 [Alectoria fallacina]
MLQTAASSFPKPSALGEHVPSEAHSDRLDSTLSVNDRQYADIVTHLVVSPYNSLPHLLDLRLLGEKQRLLAKALTVLESVRGDYATAQYHECFNWDVVIDLLKSLLELSDYQWKRQYFYIVVFRSQVPPTTDRTHLGGLDQKSHAEAMKSGGLLKYWFGLPDETGRNLATCIWRNFADARSASVGPGHKEAMRATVNMYTEWKLERLKFEIGDGAASWSITPWED